GYKCLAADAELTSPKISSSMKSDFPILSCSQNTTPVPIAASRQPLFPSHQHCLNSSTASSIQATSSCSRPYASIDHNALPSNTEPSPSPANASFSASPLNPSSPCPSL
ncbi:hypothetical protein A2U01_0023874, partial [Trifolium medium]|nr:hypothetical protein [Trifolium medium]